MITESILDAVFSFLTAILNFLPTFDDINVGGLDMMSVYAQISTWIGWANYYLPMDTFFACCLSILSTWLLCAVCSFFITIF